MHYYKHVQVISIMSLALILFMQTQTLLAQYTDPLQLRYNVQPGDAFEMHITLEGKIVTEVYRQQGVDEAEKLVKYELATMQKVESIEEEGILVVRMDPIPETVSISVDGNPLHIEGEVIPKTIFRMTKLGEIVEMQYLTPLNRILLGPEVFDFTSITHVFPKYPEETIEIGSRWRQSPAVPETGIEGVINLVGIEEINGLPCAIIQIHSSMPISFPNEQEKGLTRQGLRLQGRIEKNMELSIGLETGWPLSGNGKMNYMVTLFRDEEKLSQTIYNLDVSFSTAF